MKRALLTLACASIATGAAAAQENSVRTQADAARRRCTELLAPVAAVKNVSLFGTGASWRVVVVVTAADAISSVRQSVGDEIAGTRILVLVGAPPVPALKRGPVGQTVAEPTTQPGSANAFPQASPPAKPKKPGDDLPDCDIILDHYGVKARPRWKEGYRCQYIRRSCIPVMGFGGWTYDYTKHRPKCPVRMGTAEVPANPDNYVRWVFDKGYTPVFRGGFLYPNELRGSDDHWAAQAENDLRSRLPAIRERAEWNRPGLTPSAFRAQRIYGGMEATPGWGMSWQSFDQWQPPPAPTPGSTPGCGQGG